VKSRVLVVRFSSLGDVVLVEPALCALKERLPDARVILLTRTPYAGLHRNNPNLDEVWAFDPASQSLRDLRTWIREGDFDLIVDLHGSLRSRLITFLYAGPVARWNQERWRRFRLVVRPPFKQRLKLTPVVDLYLQTVTGCRSGTDSERRGMEENGDRRIPVIHLGEVERKRGLDWRSRLVGERPGHLIAILPGASHPPKEWPLFRVREFAELCLSRGDLPVVIPAPENPDPAHTIAHEVEGALMSEPLEDVMDLAAALAVCDGVVANDSGPMHLAAALATPTVGLFGPTSPALGFAPRGPYATDLYLDLFCSPCSKHGQRVCWRRERDCLIDIEPRQVIDTLEDLIMRKQSQKTLDL